MFRIAPAVLFAVAAGQAAVIVTGGWMNTTAAGLYTSSPAAYDQAVTTPTSTLQTTANADYNGVHNATTYDFNVGTAGYGYLLTTFDHSAEAVAGQYGEPHNQASIDFIVTDAPIDYNLSGLFNLSGSSYMTTVVGLRAGKSVLFENSQYSHATPDESFTLGQTGGDYLNTLTGNLSGTLGVGSYTLTYSFVSESALGQAHTADGFVRLEFGHPPAPAAVPEPASVALLGLGAAGLLMLRRRR